MIALYNYQRDAVDSIYRYFADNAGNPLIVIPTAGGKSLVVAEFLREIFEQWPDQRVLILTHVRELTSSSSTRHISCRAPRRRCIARSSGTCSGSTIS